MYIYVNIANWILCSLYFLAPYSILFIGLSLKSLTSSYCWLLNFVWDHCDSILRCSFWPLCLDSAEVPLGLCLSNKGGCGRDWLNLFNIFSWPHASTQNPSFFQILSGVRGQIQKLSPWPRTPPQTSSSVHHHWIRIQEGHWWGGQTRTLLVLFWCHLLCWNA